MKTGRVVRGHVLDCNKRYLERALKDYDPQLYLKWNPKKNDGAGMWELRRRPNTKTAVPRWELGKNIVFELQYVENDLLHHIMDIPYLNYQVLNKLKAMDTWAAHDWVAELEDKEEKSREKAYEDNRKDLKYAIKQYKRAFEDFKEEVRSGRSPGDFLRGTW